MDRRLATLAQRQHGVVARRQLGLLGISDTMVRERVRRGLLVRVHRGVYALGHAALRDEGRWLAAVLAVGPGALLSHRDAAALHGLRAPMNGRIDVTTTRRGREGSEAIAVHRTTVLTPLDATTRHDIPVTSVARTIVDLAGIVRRHDLARLLNEAERTGKLDAAAIERVLERTRTRRGAGHAAVRAALADLAGNGTQLTRSELEDRFLVLLDAEDLPRPLVNTIRHGHELDAYWPAANLAVELDGYAFHHTRAAFQRDRDKDNDLELAGVRLLRFTHDDVARRPHTTANRIRRALAAPAQSSGGMSR